MKPPATTLPVRPVHEMETDVLVIGAGTAMAAAMAAHELGLSTVIVEKTTYVGGSTARSGGAFWIPGNSALEAGGADDSIDGDRGARSTRRLRAASGLARRGGARSHRVHRHLRRLRTQRYRRDRR